MFFRETLLGRVYAAKGRLPCGTDKTRPLSGSRRRGDA